MGLTALLDLERALVEVRRELGCCDHSFSYLDLIFSHTISSMSSCFVTFVVGNILAPLPEVFVWEDVLVKPALENLKRAR
ncbi:hypothetical protein HYQ46_011813 [Verticillium longisporum]|nr:hypothetical protein HYQ46_011813 [Verticillium longisporum]